MKDWFVIRADVNVSIGIGHVMRCLALAEWLQEYRVVPVLLTKYKNELIKNKVLELGGDFVLLPEQNESPSATYAHSKWLNGTEEQDAAASVTKVNNLISYCYDKEPLFIMVDHYALAAPWEKLLEKISPVLVLDDLSDRPHSCTWLVDQTVGKNADSYKSLISDTTTSFIGTHYALLRKEFAEQATTFNRSFKRQNIKVLITLGGTDKNNDSIKILTFMESCKKFPYLEVVIVTGSSNPNLHDIQKYIENLPNVKLLVDIKEMANLMKLSDICIGAAGSTSWERCVMSLPTLTVVIAENQKTIASNLAAKNATINLGLISKLSINFFLEKFERLRTEQELYESLFQNSYKLCDGLGCKRIIQEVMSL